MSGKISNWVAAQVRFTAFLAGPIELSSATDWWTALLGQAPQYLSITQGALLQAAGLIDLGNLNLVVNTIGESRVDFILNPLPMPPPQITWLGEPEAAFR